jgi:hypothetical protein
MDSRETIRRWARTWREAGPVLEAIHRREVQEADNLKVLASLEDAFNHAAQSLGSRGPWSGMIEMQGYLAKLRRP